MRIQARRGNAYPPSTPRHGRPIAPPCPPRQARASDGRLPSAASIAPQHFDPDIVHGRRFGGRSRASSADTSHQVGIYRTWIESHSTPHRSRKRLRASKPPSKPGFRILRRSNASTDTAPTPSSRGGPAPGSASFRISGRISGDRSPRRSRPPPRCRPPPGNGRTSRSFSRCRRGSRARRRSARVRRRRVRHAYGKRARRRISGDSANDKPRNDGPSSRIMGRYNKIR